MLTTRVLAALVFTPAMLAIIWVGGAALAATCSILGLLMLWEFLLLTFGTGQIYIKAVAYGLAVLVLLNTLGLMPIHLGPLLAPAGALLLMCAVLLRPEPIASSIQRAALILLGVVYCAGLIPFLALLRQLPRDGLGLCLMALLSTWASDTGAYFAGKAFGRRKLYPKVSPGKTVEGGLGGLLAAVGAALGIRAAMGIDMAIWHAVCLGLIASCFGVMGDLCESMLKRSVGAKDSSHLIPGHGGVLDRFDGVMFAVPAFYIYIVVFLHNGMTP